MNENETLTQEELNELQTSSETPTEQNAPEYRFRAFKNQINGQYSIEILTYNASMMVPYELITKIQQEFEAKLAEHNGDIPVAPLEEREVPKSNNWKD